MKLADLVRQVCKDLKIPMAELARRSNQSPQNLAMKLKRGSVNFNEFQRFMDILGVKIDFALTYPDGKVAELPVQDDRVREKLELLEAGLELEKRNAAFQQRLNSDIRTAVYSAQGYVELALKHSDDQLTVLECLNKVKIVEARLKYLLDNSIYTPEKAKEEEAEVEVAIPEKIRGKRILLAEDNEMNCEITRNILEDNGLLAEVASDGVEAVEMVSNANPGYYDAILMDIQMPNMDGHEATRRIRQLPNRIRANVPVIAMTANAFDSDRKASFDAGMDDYLTKPVSATKLVQVLSKYL